MTTSPARVRTPCWCGETRGPSIGDDYHRCAACGTAVLSTVPPGLRARVIDDDEHFYGKAYWLSYQTDRGLPDVAERARADLGERCLFWLERLLESVRPPGRALEIGCGHGAFVSLLTELGFDAVGMDLSPWVVDFARRTFGVPVRQGTLETVAFEPGFACIAAFDVLEHLADPLGDVRRCAELLAPDGVLLLQTPCYRDEGADWEMFQRDEHVYLFTEASVRQLLQRAGFRDVDIRPSLFAYDMWIAASPGELRRHPADGDACANGQRLPAAFRALLDVNRQAEGLRRSLAEAEADRLQRLEQVDELTGIAKTLSEEIRKAEADHAGQVEQLTRLLQESEIDRAARLDVIRGAEAQILTLHGQIHDLETRLLQHGALRRLYRATHAEISGDGARQGSGVSATVEAMRSRVEELTRRLHESEAERATRADVLRGAQRQIASLREDIERLHGRLEQIERSAVWRVYRTLAGEK